MMPRLTRLLIFVCIALPVGHTFFVHHAYLPRQPDAPTSISSDPTDSVTPAQPKPAVKQNYVVFSTTLDEFARKEDYDYLPPLTALNWHLMGGFYPIIITVANSLETFEKVTKLWDILLPPEINSKSGHIIPIIVPPGTSSVLVAQVARLYAVSWLPEERISNDSFLRVTDADMLIYNPFPFLPPPPHVDIDIFNGNCCRGINKVGERECQQYPMHSVGMSAKHWRTLFPLGKNVTFDKYGHNLVSHVVSVAESFGHQSGEAINHGGSRWFVDQLLLGCTIDEAVENKQTYNLTLSPGPGGRPGSRRLHVGGRLRNNTYVDAHLASFRLTAHQRWLGQLVRETKAIEGYQDAYERYHEAWISSRTQ